MDSRFLETFSEVVKRGSLADAARHLGLTPAAVAQRMQTLEAEIGVALLVRSGRTVQPTEAGRAILESCERVLHEIRHMKSLAVADGLSGELRLGAIETTLTGLLPAALRWLRVAAPDLDIFLLPGTSPALFQQLATEQIDAALLVRPPFELGKGYEWRLLRREQWKLLCPAGLEVKDILETIRSLPFIRYDRDSWGGRQLEGWMRQQGIAPREWLELDSLDAIAIMVDVGLGIAVLPDWARPWPEGMNIQILDLPGTPPLREIGLLWSRTSRRGKLIRTLLTALSDGHDMHGDGMHGEETAAAARSLLIPGAPRTR